MILVRNRGAGHANGAGRWAAGEITYEGFRRLLGLDDGDAEEEEDHGDERCWDGAWGRVV